MKFTTRILLLVKDMLCTKIYCHKDSIQFYFHVKFRTPKEQSWNMKLALLWLSENRCSRGDTKSSAYCTLDRFSRTRRLMGSWRRREARGAGGVREAHVGDAHLQYYHTAAFIITTQLLKLPRKLLHKKSVNYYILDRWSTAHSTVRSNFRCRIQVLPDTTLNGQLEEAPYTKLMSVMQRGHLHDYHTVAFRITTQLLRLPHMWLRLLHILLLRLLHILLLRLLHILLRNH